MITVTGPNPSLLLTEANDVLVAATGSITSGEAAIWTSFADTSVLVAGSLMSQTVGVFATLGNGVGGTIDIEVLAGGLAYGGMSGMFLAHGSYAIDNAGLIKGHVGISTTTTDADGLLSLRNTGTVMGDATAISIGWDSNNHTDLNLVNFGRIIADQEAIAVLNPASYAQIVNHGEIFGAILGNAGGDSLVNKGLIEGQVMLQGGADFVNNRGGRGEVFLCDLGEGDDFVILGRMEEEIAGGAGRDDVSYESSTAVLINLADLTRNKGAAAGDVYLDVERFVGSDRGNDTLLGDAGNNAFLGMGGADRLTGNGGSDTLEGGRGADTLAGGAGADQFAFVFVTDGGDTISDFTRGAAADKITVSASGFGGGLVAGALGAARFQLRADNLAQDDNDRFIFDTTTRTLWFDADGVGAGSDAVLIATLTSGPDLAASDILIV